MDPIQRGFVLRTIFPSAKCPSCGHLRQEPCILLDHCELRDIDEVVQNSVVRWQYEYSVSSIPNKKQQKHPTSYRKLHVVHIRTLSRKTSFHCRRGHTGQILTGLWVEVEVACSSRCQAPSSRLCLHLVVDLFGDKMDGIPPLLHIQAIVCPCREPRPLTYNKPKRYMSHIYQFLHSMSNNSATILPNL
ncbi:hypothetical protein K474DRAFT_675595 [Panus rudis PR-1116 ss-1]|nr:hypothetical protein K474DRAFT_675595 [Panus rudis PR-1116 ss-1]